MNDTSNPKPDLTQILPGGRVEHRWLNEDGSTYKQQEHNVHCDWCELKRRPGDPRYSPLTTSIAVKYDSDKPQFSLIPTSSLLELMKVYEMGAKKYAPDNWKKGMKWSRVYDAIIRHLFAFWKGETNDPESGLHHMAHAAWGCFTLIWYSQNNGGEDDR